MNRAKVLVVEDDNFTRSTLVAAIRTQGIEVVGSASNARDALAIQARFAPDIAMLDFDLGPGPTGIDVAHALRSRQPNIGILILSTFRDPRLLSTKLPPLPSGSLYLCKQDIDDVRKIVDQLQMVNERRFGKVVRKIFPKREAIPLTEMQMDVLFLVSNLPFELVQLPIHELMLWFTVSISVVSGISYFLQAKDLILESM